MVEVVARRDDRSDTVLLESLKFLLLRVPIELTARSDVGSGVVAAAKRHAHRDDVVRVAVLHAAHDPVEGLELSGQGRMRLGHLVVEDPQPDQAHPLGNSDARISSADDSRDVRSVAVVILLCRRVVVEVVLIGHRRGEEGMSEVEPRIQHRHAERLALAIDGDRAVYPSIGRVISQVGEMNQVEVVLRAGKGHEHPLLERGEAGSQSVQTSRGPSATIPDAEPVWE